MIMIMLSSLSCRAGRAALLMSASLAAAAPAQAQYLGEAPPPPAAPGYGMTETPEAALARNLRLIADNPRNFQALVAAGKAALETGDTQAAAGFFGRAEDLSPRAWQPQFGMATVMVAMGDPAGALRYFTRAQEFGATQLQIALDRGLAFDLSGDQVRAQSDYRAALSGPQADEARRRLALSLAISRDIKGAAATIQPLLLRRDPHAVRINAFVLALAGDFEGARRTIDSVRPGAGASFEPFFRTLPVLQPAEKAAAVHLGIFPKDAAQRRSQAVSGSIAPAAPAATMAQQRPVAPSPKAQERQDANPSTRMASVQPTLDPSRLAATRGPKTPATTPKTEAGDADPEPRPADRLDEIARLLSEQPDQADGEGMVQVADAQPDEQAPEPAFADVPVSRPKVETPKARAEPAKPKADAKKAAADKKKADKLAAEKKAKAEAEKKAKAEAAKLGVAGANWVQIAGGANKDRMAVEYKKLTAKAGSVLKSRAGYVTEGKDYFRLLVGPFATTDEAQAFVRKLDKAGVDSFRWTRNPTQIRIEKLKS